MCGVMHTIAQAEIAFKHKTSSLKIDSEFVTGHIVYK